MEACKATCKASYSSRTKRLVLKCPVGQLGGDLADNDNCRGKVTFLLLSRKARFKELAIISSRVRKTYSSSTLDLLHEYVEELRSARQRVMDSGLLKVCEGPLSCLESRRGFLRRLFSIQPPMGEVYAKPLEALTSINEELEKLSAIEKQLPGCQACLSEYGGALKKLRSSLSKTRLCKRLIEEYSRLKIVEAAYAKVFKASKVEALSWRAEEEGQPEGGRLLDEYEAPPFYVRILYLSPVERLYAPMPMAKPWERALLSEVVRGLRHSSSYMHGLINQRLSLLMELRRREAARLLRQQPWLRESSELGKHDDHLIELAVFKSLGLLKIAPFLVDDQVEEFFLDKPLTHVYLIHTKWGRCRSSIKLHERDVERIVTHLKVESGKPLDYENPSLKCEVMSSRFHVRASIDFPPLAVDGPSLDFRKFRRKVWTLPELVDNDTLTSELASYLVFCLFRRRNITIVGEPNTGKTTLANALDLCTPPHWRKIYIEDVTESIPQRELGKHQVRLRVDPFESRRRTLTKSLEVLKLLHRSPDLVFLAEIQTPEHTKALFQSLGAGLRGLQTCHASTIEGLIRRWVLHHGIHPVNILDLDLLVLMKSYSQDGREVRRVVKLCEVAPHEEGYKIVEVFSWSPGLGLLKLMDLYETPVVAKIKEFEEKTRSEFFKELSEYREVIERLAASRAGPKEVAENFAQLFFKYVA